MKTYPLIDDNSGFQYGFEIDKIYISINRIVKLLSTVKNVSNINKRRLFDTRRGDHISFDYLGDEFVVFEPFGYNIRFWICAKNTPPAKVNISDIEFVFKKYEPPMFVKILGDILSLNIEVLSNKNRK